MQIPIEQNILSANDAIAAMNRARLHDHDIFSINIMSSPGAGKTSLLEALLPPLASELSIGVIEGDLATDNDAVRLQALGIQTLQMSTKEYKSSCHMNALMIQNALPHFDLDLLDFLVIENVGNLVCPAGYDLGEDKRIVLISTTEGEDKPLKYPTIFMRADLVIINKIDLLEALEMDVKVIEDNIRAVNPKAEIMKVSARKGDGMEDVKQWLNGQMAL